MKYSVFNHYFNDIAFANSCNINCNNCSINGMQISNFQLIKTGEQIARHEDLGEQNLARH
jgi:hypothetical protein